MPSERAARQQLADRTIDGALIVGPRGRPDRLLVAGGGGASLAQAVELVVRAAEKAEHRTVRTVDVTPAAAGDSRSLSSFYLVVGWCVGGYLCAAILAISAGARPSNGHRAVIRLAALALYAVVAGLAGAIIVGPVLGALPGTFFGLWGLGALIVFAVGATTLACQALLGIIGIGLAILLIVILGNPSAGGAYPYPLLPPFWRAIGPALPGSGHLGRALPRLLPRPRGHRPAPGAVGLGGGRHLDHPGTVDLPQEGRDPLMTISANRLSDPAPAAYDATQTAATLRPTASAGPTPKSPPSPAPTHRSPWPTYSASRRASRCTPTTHCRPPAEAGSANSTAPTYPSPYWSAPSTRTRRPRLPLTCTPHSPTWATN